MTATPFERFWSCYPKRIGKGAALKSWEKLEQTEEFFLKIILAVDAQKRFRGKVEQANRLVPERMRKFLPEWPHPSTWLNQQRWEDEIPSTSETVDKIQNEKAEKCDCGKTATIPIDSRWFCSWCYSKTYCTAGPTGLDILRAAFKRHNLHKRAGESGAEYLARCTQIVTGGSNSFVAKAKGSLAKTGQFPFRSEDDLPRG